ncbi:SORD [Branchiostoma lanceolatum]|uniref:alcohol dehydrogenase n=1 Tax=Branchiostoma lanceolatum TaxID=7740 RepID=A0A8J9WEH0_BRALA|nr:SORD [Branchiostoma lanceolatum]
MSAQKVVFHGPANTPACTVEHGPAPEPGPGEMLGKVLLATVCGSDLHLLSGRRHHGVPSVLGHEAVLEVVRDRRGDGGLPVGSRVTFSIIDSCFNCDRCSAGLPQKCRQLFKYGHALLSNGTGFNGCYATHLVVRRGVHVVPIPDHVTDRMAAPVNCALATVVNAVSCIPGNENIASEFRHQLNVGLENVSSHGDDVTNRDHGNDDVISKGPIMVQGAGLLGLYACALLRERGYERVFCTDLNEERLKLVPGFGGTPVLAGKEDPEDSGKENSFDAVIEVCGAPSVVPSGVRLLRPGGTYVLVGMVHPQSQLDIRGDQIIMKCLSVHGVHNYAPWHLTAAVQFLARTADKYPYEDLVGEDFPLSEFSAAAEMAEKQVYPRVALKP